MLLVMITVAQISDCTANTQHILSHVLLGGYGINIYVIIGLVAAALRLCYPHHATANIYAFIY